ncbi:MAG: hypothetical protein V4557_05225 [Bacteroidota bacterium]
MKITYFFFFLFITAAGCNSQEATSSKKIEDIALLNKIEFTNPKFDQPKFSCGFLLAYANDTFAVTAKHLLQIIKPDDMATLFFTPSVKSWTLFPMTHPTENVVTEKLLNENAAESLADKKIYDNDWLVFSIKENHSKIKPLQPRLTPLVAGEKLYLAGWTRKMEDGPQRVYEFEYYKTIGQRILLKDLVVPETFGGLSGAPLVDEQGLVAGLVSNGTVDPITGKKYFSPCSLTSLLNFLDKLSSK